MVYGMVSGHSHGHFGNIRPQRRPPNHSPRSLPQWCFNDFTPVRFGTAQRAGLGERLRPSLSNPTEPSGEVTVSWVFGRQDVVRHVFKKRGVGTRSGARSARTRGGHARVSGTHSGHTLGAHIRDTKCGDAFRTRNRTPRLEFDEIASNRR